MSDGPDGPTVPIGKDGQFIVCHAHLATTEFIQENRFIFNFNLKALSDYHNELNSQMFKKWLEEQFLLSVITMIIIPKNVYVHSEVIRGTEELYLSNWSTFRG